ncbi:MAG: TonB family protein [Candidatus Symbiothrix sp.]|jgi:protein TonB|nr:TonB family protein [Candidatus Symbiothrix sp.]
MEIKKNVAADLEKERKKFFFLGLTLALAGLFVAFEWTSDNDAPLPLIAIPDLAVEDYTDADLSVETTPAAVLEKETPPPVVYEDFNEVPTPEEMLITPETPLDEPIAEEDPPQLDLGKPLSELSETVYTDAEVMPQFPGGRIELNRFVYARLKYPASAYTQKIAGRVWCSFIVNRDGTISELKIEQGVYISLDQETLRVMQQMPNWIPGSVRGEPVRVKVYLPIMFKL